ncbi:hypothetical protein OG884_27080 [Streptosporangium sp. NBC_01755]|uniref:NAD-dependent epimerase/dehydratase family protein n=1 Tax=unclassified Streptosporangium TaxID=2632669 RepID=UPI002DD90FCA|nr:MULTISPECIES: NAD-dependent epimerase/dehydratase family protein [unclassified Streptosporangium]WSA23354.1 hypothetical protein OIE13_20530 [Streptosporangium sp. NBC_01810]WSC98509.1 hypothetical protein OG884_27080 [Streptosporangium sp. NBC_01755]
MAKHVVAGAGQVGSEVARLLAGQGHEVVLVSRSGSGPEVPGIRRVAADAGDRAGLTALTEGAAVLYNCVNPPYHRWARDWPPLAASLLRTVGAFSPMLGELEELRYQFVRPFVLDSGDFQAAFGIAPTPMDEALAETIAWWRDRLAAAA